VKKRNTGKKSVQRTGRENPPQLYTVSTPLAEQAQYQNRVYITVSNACYDRPVKTRPGNAIVSYYCWIWGYINILLFRAFPRQFQKFFLAFLPAYMCKN